MAVYPVVPGSPDYSTGSTNQYIPAIYSALLIKKFYPKTVFGQISNTDYEGDIKTHGDTVYIRTRPTIETFRYKKGMVLPVQNPESPYVTLKIDQGEGFSFAIDRVDEFQSDIKLMNTWAEDATEQMKQVIDRNVLVSLAAAGAVAGGQVATTVTGYTTVAGPTLNYPVPSSSSVQGIVAGGYTIKGSSISTGLGTSAASISASDSDKITAQILKFGRYLDENNAPEEGRFVIVPFWVLQNLKSMTKNFGLAYATGANGASLITGNIPKIDRFEIIGSNNLPTTTEAAVDPTAIIFGCKYATTFATQITESRIIDNPFAFGKMMQGLQVYGFNVVKPQLLGVDFWKNA